MITRARRHALQIALVVCVALSWGCNVVQGQREDLRCALTSAGLSAHDEVIAGFDGHYWEGGEGEVVVLLHGFGASAIWQWTAQAEDLAKDHRVIVPDLLWFGGSSAAPGQYSLDDQVRFVVALLDHLGVQRASVVGVSYGGFVGYELAAAHPTRVDRLVLVDSPGRTYTMQDYLLLCARFGVADLSGVLVPDDPDGVRRLMSIAYHDPPWVPDWAAQQILDELYSTHREEKVALLQAILDERQQIQSRPYDVQAPTLLVWGRHDEVFPLETAERLAQHLGPKATLEIMEEARHAPPVEHPEAFNARLRAFLAR